MDGFEQIVIPQSLVSHVLHLSDHAKMGNHPDGWRHYQSIFWPNMSVDCYATARPCVSYAKDRVALQQKSNGLQLLPALAPLEFATFVIFGQLLLKKWGNRFLLVLNGLFFKASQNHWFYEYVDRYESKRFLGWWSARVRAAKLSLIQQRIQVYVQAVATSMPDSGSATTQPFMDCNTTENAQDSL